MPVITLAGRDFPLKASPPKSGAMLAIAAAERSGDGLKAMALYYKLITSIIDDGKVSLDDVDDALAELDVEEVNVALEAAAKTYTADPTSAAQSTSGRSSSGSQDGTPTSRVVSFSQAKTG